MNQWSGRRDDRNGIYEQTNGRMDEQMDNLKDSPPGESKRHKLPRHHDDRCFDVHLANGPAKKQILHDIMRILLALWLGSKSLWVFRETSRKYPHIVTYQKLV